MRKSSVFRRCPCTYPWHRRHHQTYPCQITYHSPTSYRYIPDLPLLDHLPLSYQLQVYTRPTPARSLTTLLPATGIYQTYPCQITYHSPTSYNRYIPGIYSYYCTVKSSNVQPPHTVSVTKVFQCFSQHPHTVPVTKVFQCFSQHHHTYSTYQLQY